MNPQPVPKRKTMRRNLRKVLIEKKGDTSETSRNRMSYKGNEHLGKDCLCKSSSACTYLPPFIMTNHFDPPERSKGPPVEIPKDDPAAGREVTNTPPHDGNNNGPSGDFGDSEKSEKPIPGEEDKPFDRTNPDDARL